MDVHAVPKFAHVVFVVMTAQICSTNSSKHSHCLRPRRIRADMTSFGRKSAESVHIMLCRKGEMDVCLSSVKHSTEEAFATVFCPEGFWFIRYTNDPPLNGPDLSVDRPTKAMRPSQLLWFNIKPNSDFCKGLAQQGWLHCSLSLSAPNLSGHMAYNNFDLIRRLTKS